MQRRAKGMAVAFLGLWGCARGPANGSISLERIKTLEAKIAKLEDDLLEMANQLGIGPMGLGGDTTCLGVNVEMAYTHMTLNPVAVNTQCWAARRAVARLWADGKIEVGH